MFKLTKRTQPHKPNTMRYGFAVLFDGLVRVFSLGYLCTTAPDDSARKWVRKQINTWRRKS